MMIDTSSSTKVVKFDVLLLQIPGHQPGRGAAGLHAVSALRILLTSNNYNLRIIYLILTSSVPVHPLPHPLLRAEPGGGGRLLDLVRLRQLRVPRVPGVRGPGQ